MREGEKEWLRREGRYTIVDFSLQNVGLALRDLLSKVDEVLQDLPQQTHQEVGRKRWCGEEREREGSAWGGSVERK